MSARHFFEATKLFWPYILAPSSTPHFRLHHRCWVAGTVRPNEHRWPEKKQKLPEIQQKSHAQTLGLPYLPIYPINYRQMWANRSYMFCAWDGEVMPTTSLSGYMDPLLDTWMQVPPVFFSSMKQLGWWLCSVFWGEISHLHPRKNPLTFHYTCCLIGSLVMSFIIIHHITGSIIPLYTLNN